MNECDEIILKKYTIDIAKFVMELMEKNIKPARMDYTVENGMYFLFKNKNRMMHVEIYYNGDIGYIICENKNMPECKDVNINELIERVLFFMRSKNGNT